MNDTCICENTPRVWRLTGVTRTLRLRIFNPDGTPLDLSGREAAVTIARDNSEFSYAPGFVIEGDDDNVVKFEWPANKQGAGDYTINVTTTDGSGNVDRVNWHGPTGIRLVDFSFMVRGEDALGVTSEANIGLDGTFTMNGTGMSAYDEWLAEGHTGTPEEFIAWLRQPAVDAASAAEAQMGQIQERADADHTRAGNDHTTAGQDHTRAGNDHTTATDDHRIAAADHSTATDDHTLAASDHVTAAEDHRVAGIDHGTAADDHTRAASDHQTASDDHTQAGSDHTRAGQDHTRAGDDHTTASGDHTRAGEDHTTAGNDHTRAGEDHTQAGNDHTRAEADHGTAADDHTQATADHAVMAGYDTRLGNVESEVSQLGQEVNGIPSYDQDIVVNVTSGTGLARTTKYAVNLKAGVTYELRKDSTVVGSGQFWFYDSSDNGSNISFSANGVYYYTPSVDIVNVGFYVMGTQVSGDGTFNVNIYYDSLNIGLESNIQQLNGRDKKIGIIETSYGSGISTPLVSNYALSYFDGSPVSSMGTVISDYVPIADGIKFTTRLLTNTNYASYCIYDAEKNFIKAVRISAEAGVNTVIELPYSDGYVRWTQANNPSVSTYQKFEGTVSGKLANNEKALSFVGVSDFRGKDFYETSAGLLLSADGTIDTSLTNRRVSGYIPFEADVKIYNAFQASNSTYAQAIIYNADKQFVASISGTSGQTSDSVTIVKASYPNGAFIRYSLESPSKTCIAETQFGIKKYVDRYAISANYKKSIAIFGGSFATDSSLYNTGVALKKWKEKLNVEIDDYAVGGAGFTPQASSLINTQVDTACAAGVDPYDIYIIWASGNDFSMRGAIGEQSDYTADDSFDADNLNTQCGGINYCVKKIIEKAPTAKICFFTSLRYLDSEPGWNPFSTNNYAMKKYVDAQKSCCERWGIPCLDQFREIAWNPYNAASMMNSVSDPHPSAVAYEYIANRQIDFIAKL